MRIKAGIACRTHRPIHALARRCASFLQAQEVRAAAFLAAILVASAATAQTFSGAARIIDGDTLAIGRTTFRLFGVDAPEARQTCDAGPTVWKCGDASTEALRTLTASKAVECTQRDRDRYGRIVAICKVDGTDLGAALVRQGWALAYRQYSTAYVPLEDLARRERVGIWRSGFIDPADWRRGVR